jgi:hypothetical protein
VEWAGREGGGHLLDGIMSNFETPGTDVTMEIVIHVYDIEASLASLYEKSFMTRSNVPVFSWHPRFNLEWRRQAFSVQ